MKFNKKIFTTYSFLILIFCFILINPFNLKIEINMTKSLPDLFFITEPVTENTKYEIGDIVSFPFIRNDRYFKKGTNFGKAISCKPGQYLYVDKNKSFYCDGRMFAAALNSDSKGNKVENFYFNGVIPQNKFFVMGSAINSYDSRYWGFLDKKDIKRIAIW
jgi:signal peptidase I